MKAKNGEILDIAAEPASVQEMFADFDFQARILDQIEDRVTVTDLKGHVIYVNNAVCRLLKKRKEDLLGKHVTRFGEDSRAGATQMEILEQTLSKGRWRGEVVNLCSDGTHAVLDCRTHLIRDGDGRPVALCGISTEITHRKQAEMRLQESEEKYRSLVENAGEAIYVVQDGKLRFLNQKAVEMIGYSKKELASKPIVDLIYPDDREMVLNRHLARQRGEALPYRYEMRVIHKDGGIRWGELRVARIDWEGRPATLNFMVDITQRHKLMEEKSELQSQYQQAQKMESIGRMAGGVAHDLNNLLTPILGYGEILADQLEEDDPRRASLDQMLTAAERARDLVRQLLAFSRKQVLEFRIIDLNHVLKEFEKLLRRTLREDIDLQIKSNDGAPISGDVGQLEQVIMNLAVNAQDAMPQGGSLIMETAFRTFEVRDASLPDHVSPGDYVCLRVEDTGCGMDQQTLTKVFEPFFTTKTRGKGTGLGLSMVYGIVQQHGGFLNLASDPGVGTTVSIYLPVRRDDPVNAPPEKVKPPDLAGAETIVVVEDDEMVRELSETLLVRQGYQVFAFDTAEAAITFMNSEQQCVDLLLTDVVLPKMSGKKLFEFAVNLFPKIRILYMSGYPGEEVHQSGVCIEDAPFIQKPFSVTALAEKVRQVLDG